MQKSKTSKVDESKKVKAPTVKPVNKAKAPKALKAETVNVEVETAKVEVKKTEVVKPEKEKSKVTLNQELNIVIGILSIFTIICFCLEFQGGASEILGWEIILKSGAYSGVFKGIMALFVIALVVDCVLTIHINTENEVFNIIEKVLYVCTAVLNIIVLALLAILISSVGLGFIIFIILTIVSVITKLARIYAKK